MNQKKIIRNFEGIYKNGKSIYKTDDLKWKNENFTNIKNLF